MSSCIPGRSRTHTDTSPFGHGCERAATAGAVGTAGTVDESEGGAACGEAGPPTEPVDENERVGALVRRTTLLAELAEVEERPPGGVRSHQVGASASVPEPRRREVAAA
mmetsp:Transcript_67648/g.144778  ORF Transcript_67648/g.144778 Transcript_67648/m.144778 type:complete len:109 (-) Transcript_67648:393-719(-)